MNISLSSEMAQFVRDKVKKGEYTNSSEVVRDAVRRMQEQDAVKQERAFFASFESRLTSAGRESIRRRVRQGIEDIEAGRYEEYDADGLKALAEKLVATSGRKLSKRRKR